MFRSPNFRFYLLAILLAASLLTLLFQQEPKKSLSQNIDIDIGSKPSVLVVNISGGILPTPTRTTLSGRAIGGVGQWIRDIDNAATNDSILGVLIYMNSPGGTIVASQELYDAMVRFRETSDKPLFVSVSDICASGGYYVSAPATTIMATRGSLVGSIGVRIENNNVTELFKKIGIESRTFKSVPYKDFLSSTREMTEIEREHVQSLVEDMHEQFVSDIITWRGEKSSPETIREVANGFLYLSEEALSYGLIDEIGSFYEAKRRLAEQLDIPFDDLVFRSSQAPTWWLEDILGASTDHVNDVLSSIMPRILEDAIEDALNPLEKNPLR